MDMPGSVDGKRLNVMLVRAGGLAGVGVNDKVLTMLARWAVHRGEEGLDSVAALMLACAGRASWPASWNNQQTAKDKLS